MNVSTVLEKARRICYSVLNRAAYSINLQELTQIVASELDANVCIASANGRILGYGLVQGFEDEGFLKEGQTLPGTCAANILRVIETTENIRLQKERYERTKCPLPGEVITIVPIHCGGERLGTLVLSRFEGEFSDEELALAECVATIVGMEMIRSKDEEDRTKVQRRMAVNAALRKLSLSEQQGLRAIIKELNGRRGILIVGSIAEKTGLSKTTIVSVLRMLESAGLVETHSLGHKGTYVRILDEELIHEVEKLEPLSEAIWNRLNAEHY